MFCDANGSKCLLCGDHPRILSTWQPELLMSCSHFSHCRALVPSTMNKAHVLLGNRCCQQVLPTGAARQHALPGNRAADGPTARSCATLP